MRAGGRHLDDTCTLERLAAGQVGQFGLGGVARGVAAQDQAWRQRGWCRQGFDTQPELVQFLLASAPRRCIGITAGKHQPFGRRRGHRLPSPGSGGRLGGGQRRLGRLHGIGGERTCHQAHRSRFANGVQRRGSGPGRQHGDAFGPHLLGQASGLRLGLARGQKTRCQPASHPDEEQQVGQHQRGHDGAQHQAPAEGAPRRTLTSPLMTRCTPPLRTRSAPCSSTPSATPSSAWGWLMLTGLVQQQVAARNRPPPAARSLRARSASRRAPAARPRVASAAGALVPGSISCRQA
jgi:hypothetical protein